jgi:hypothetical protein
MTAPDRPAYSERDPAPEEMPRGQILDVLAEGDLWAFLRADLSRDGIGLKIECHDALDVEMLKGLLRKTLAGLP